MNIYLFAGSFLSLAGLLILVLGLLFLIASDGMQSRKSAGIAMSIAGGLLFLIGTVIFRKGIIISPRGIRGRILKLARLNNGEITGEMITAELGDSKEVRYQVEDLVIRHIAEKNEKEGRTIYIFNDFKTGLMVKQCPYCGNDYPVRQDIENCPSCGGDLKMAGKKTGAGDLFSMDE